MRPMKPMASEPGNSHMASLPGVKEYSFFGAGTAAVAVAGSMRRRYYADGPRKGEGDPAPGGRPTRPE